MTLRIIKEITYTDKVIPLYPQYYVQRQFNILGIKFWMYKYSSSGDRLYFFNSISAKDYVQKLINEKPIDKTIKTVYDTISDN